MVKHFYASAVFFLQHPAITTPEQQVDNDCIMSSESQLAYVFASECVLVHHIECFACLDNSQWNVVAVVEFGGAGGA